MKLCIFNQKASGPLASVGALLGNALSNLCWQPTISWTMSSYQRTDPPNLPPRELLAEKLCSKKPRTLMSSKNNWFKKELDIVQNFFYEKPCSRVALVSKPCYFLLTNDDWHLSSRWMKKRQLFIYKWMSYVVRKDEDFCWSSLRWVYHTNMEGRPFL